MKKLLLLFLVCISMHIFGQNAHCGMDKTSLELYRVDSEILKCIAKNSTKKNTIFYTFGVWCKPCIYGIPYALSLELNYDVDVYVLIVDSEDSQYIRRTLDFFSLYENNYQLSKTKILLLKDSQNNKSRKRKYKDFLKKITPPRFENIADMSKYIVFNNFGEVLLVTNYKDSKDNDDWKDDRPMINKLIVPLLSKKLN